MIFPRLKSIYNNIIKKNITNRFFLTNNLSIPKLLKVVVSVSTKEAISDSSIIENIFNDLYLITGQKPLIIKSKKSISAFKLRVGMNIGVKVTLRRRLMYEFIDRLVNIALPRIRDFKGLNANQFDNNGNYSFGIKEQIIFPEVKYNINKNIGMGIVIETSSNNIDHAKFLLEQFNFPFEN